MDTAYRYGERALRVGATVPRFVRGEAFRVAHQGAGAAAEFQKIVNYRGTVLNAPVIALAHFDLAATAH